MPDCSRAREFPRMAPDHPLVRLDNPVRHHSCEHRPQSSGYGNRKGDLGAHRVAVPLARADPLVHDRPQAGTITLTRSHRHGRLSRSVGTRLLAGGRRTAVHGTVLERADMEGHRDLNPLLTQPHAGRSRRQWSGRHDQLLDFICEFTDRSACIKLQGRAATQQRLDLPHVSAYLGLIVF